MHNDLLVGLSTHPNKLWEILEINPRLMQFSLPKLMVVLICLCHHIMMWWRHDCPFGHQGLWILVWYGGLHDQMFCLCFHTLLWSDDSHPKWITFCLKNKRGCDLYNMFQNSHFYPSKFHLTCCFDIVIHNLHLSILVLKGDVKRNKA